MMARTKAPGKAHRTAISLIEIMRMFPDNETAEAWFAKNRWPDGVHCPACGSTNVQTGAASKKQPYRCRERECRRRFSVKTGTVMQSSNLDYQTWAIASYLCLTDL
ncbi:MAG: transposase, partial [Rhodospirillaceae bacterium]|nr:transposase [Rhodospirillaceae bacterium]